MTASDLLERISVVAPYLALANIAVEEDGVHASIPPCNDTGREVGPIPTAEASRHLALLGSLAAARAQEAPGRHYYLAYQGVVRRADEAGEVATGLSGVARFSGRDRLRTSASACMYGAGGELLFELDAQYLVLSPTAFEMLYEDLVERQQEAGALRPDEGEDVSTRYRSPSPSRLEATVRFGEHVCLGHFPGFPALPVARLAGLFNQGVLRWLAARGSYAEARFQLTCGQIDASRLLLPGDEICVTIDASDLGDSRHSFTCTASCRGEVAARMTLEALALV